MIKNIFLPESIKNYYLFPKRVIGFDIGRTEIHACVMQATGKIRTIEMLIKEPIENNMQLSGEERIAKAIQSILARVGSYDAIYVALPSSHIIFKELNLPFSSLQKIKLVLPFEVESMLPFSLDQAIIDAIVTHVYPDGNSDVLVAAVKRDYIEEQLRIFAAAGTSIDKITVDMFELYGLYQELPAYRHATKTVALIDIGIYSTRIAVIIDKQLRYIRVIPRGIITISKKIQHDFSSQNANVDALEHYIRFGVEKNDNQQFTQYAKAATHDLISEINFTVSNYTSKLKNVEQLSHITLTGEGSEIPGLAQLFEQTLNIGVDIFEGKKIVHNNAIKTGLSHIPQSYSISVATAISPTLTDQFNLQKIELNQKDEQVFNRQIIAISVLLLVILTSFITFSFIRSHSLKKAYVNSQKEIIEKLKKSFNIPDKSTKNLKSTLNAAEAKLADLKRKWSPLSHKNRFSFLKFLYELSRNINRADLGLDLSSITLDQDEIVLRGKVKNLEALTQLENSLKSEYFTLEESPQTPDFKQKPIKLKIKDQHEVVK